MSRAIAAQHRTRAVDLSPWAAAALGNPRPNLPDGYRITGLARSPQGPYSLCLFRPGEARDVAEHRDIRQVSTARTLFDALVDLAWIDVRERGGALTVTTDGAGWVTSIEEAS